MSPVGPGSPGPTGHTRVAGVIGHPVAHSLSPTIHNAAFAATGLDWVYVAFPVGPGRAADAIAAVRALDLGGLSVTMPHKADVLDHLDRLDPDAGALGAVNCVAVDPDGALVGHNTDGAGLVDSLAADAGFDPAGRRCVVLGAGGAARAVVLALARAGAADVAVVARRIEAAEGAAALAGDLGRAAGPDALDGADLVVNATPVGMRGGPDPGGVPVEPHRLVPGLLVVDLVYHPLRPALLAAAEARGARTLGGLGMLVHQAARAFTLWTGVAAPVEAMRRAVETATAEPDASNS